MRAPTILHLRIGRLLILVTLGSLTFATGVPPAGAGERSASAAESVGPTASGPASLSARRVIGAAGDIACDPGDRFFLGSFGATMDCKMRATSDLLLSARPNLVLALGDLQYEDGTLDKFRASYEPTWGRLRSITRPVPGGHEYMAPGAAGYFDYFNGVGQRRGRAGVRGRGYYSFNFAGWHIVALNDNCEFREVRCASDSRQVRWLRRDLRRHRRRCQLAFAHRPQFSSSITGAYRPFRNMFRVLYRARVDVLLSGDSHNYERFAPQTPGGRHSPRRGVRQFVVGTGGKNLGGFGPIWPNSEARSSTAFGALFLQLNRRSYSWKFVRAAGWAYADSGRDRCH